MRLKSGIEFRLIVLGLVPAAFFLFLLTAQFIQTGTDELDRGLRQRGTDLAQRLAAAAESGVLTGNRSRLQNLAADMLREDDVVGAGIFDRTGNRLVLAERDSVGPRTDRHLEFIEPVVLGDGGHAFRETADSAARDSGRKTMGSVRVTLSREAIAAARQKVWMAGLAIAAGGLALTALFAYRLGRTISLPIIALTRSVHALAEGRLDERADFPATAELADLKDGLNAMADQLQRHRETLEQQVQQATWRLQETLRSLEKQNAELARARLYAEAQTEIKSQFLAEMSHEIRTPMNGIIGFAELLARTPLSDSQTDKLQLIERSAKNLLAILNEVLDLSKVEANKINLKPEVFQLRPYLEDVVALLLPQAQQLSIILSIEPGVPRSVYGDPIRLQQVLTNLLSNAVKFTEAGRILIRVRPRPFSQEKQLLISVSDTGRGIPPKDLNRLFAPFLQLSAYALDNERGTGLGLTIAKNIVESMGGKIGVASKPGMGSTFWFTFPIPQEPAVEPVPITCSVALIDKNPLSRKALQYQLEELGVKTACFASAVEFERSYDPREHGTIALFNVTDPTQPLLSITSLIEHSKNLGASPVLILPFGDLGIQDFYRTRGAICLNQPVRSESLQKFLLNQSRFGSIAPSVTDGVPAAGGTALHDKCFLVVDDNDINRILLKSQLFELGAKVFVAQDGKEALELIRTTRFDLIFLDLLMPGMSGLDVMKELRRTDDILNRHTPVIAVTAHARPQQRETILRAGFSDCLIKPVLSDQLVKMIGARLPAEPPMAERRSIPADEPPADFYTAILERTGQNRTLALSLVRKLVQELPQQLREVQEALQADEVKKARDTTHKLNGSASFCGLVGIRKAAAALEDALLAESTPKEQLLALVRELEFEIGLFLGAQGRLLAALSGFESNGRTGTDDIP
jgi:two-component system sensor histidine kinase BarA